LQAHAPGHRFLGMDMSKHNAQAVLLAALVLLAPIPSFALQPVELRAFSSVAQCSGCSIEVITRATLQFPFDSVAPGTSSRITRTSDGRFLVYWLQGNPVPALFDATGRFQRIVAVRGQGPGEIRRATSILVAPGDSVWIIDGSRKHVYSPSMNYVRQDPIRRGGAFFAVSGSGAIVTGGMIGTPASAGLPLHLLDRDFSVVRSFGSHDATLDPRRMQATGDDPPLMLARQFAPAGDNEFWTFNYSRFLLERYDYSGRQIARFRHSLDGWYGTSSRRKPSVGEFAGLALSHVSTSADPSVVWLMYQDPRPEYATPAPGTPFDHRAWIAMHDLVIEALDTRRGVVLATARIPRTSAVGVDNGRDMLAIVQPVDEDFNTFRIVDLRLLR
jgi:hypothetical protein